MSAISGVSGTNAASAAAQADKSNAVTIQQLKKQYPHLKLSAQAFGSEAAVKSYAMNQTGKYNVAIHPKALDRMGSDETFSEKIHETLGGAKEYQDKLESMIEASGAKLIACGQYIDENGNCGSWSVSQTSSEGPGLFSSGKTQKQMLQKIQERRAKQRDDLEELQEKRQAEKAEQTESLEIDVEVAVEKKAGTVDIQA